MLHRGDRAVLESIPVSDRYTVDRELGRGGMAVVYLARDRKHDRPVAIKILRPEIVAGEDAQRFLLEIQILARLQHPHILPLLDSGATDESSPRPYYVMPYVDGETLRQRLTREGPLPVLGGVAPGAGGRRGASLRARGRSDSSRREARERPALARPRPGRGLRHRACRGHRGRRPPDPARPEHGDPCLHESRAGRRRPRGRRPGGPVQPRLRPLRAAGGSAALHRARHVRRVVAPGPRPGAAAHHASPGSARVGATGRRAGPVQGPGGPVRDRAGVPGGPGGAGRRPRPHRSRPSWCCRSPI